MIQGRRHFGSHITREFIEDIQRKDKAGEDLRTLPYPEIYGDFNDV